MIPKDISKAIDVIRGLAAIGVIWGHSVYGFDLPLDLNGAFWVWIFLPVSGYLIGRGFIDHRYNLSIQGYKKFILNRGLRIVPLYEIALFLGILFEKIGSTDEKTNLSNAVRQITFTTSHTTLSGPLWTVTAEIHFYLIAILIVALVIKISNRFYLIALLIIAFSIAGLYNGITYGYFVQPKTLIGNFHFFVFGMILSTRYFENLATVSRNCKVLMVITLVAIAWYIENWQLGYFWGFGKLTNKFIFMPLGGASLIAMLIAMVVLCFNVNQDKGNIRLWLIIRPFVKFFGFCGFYTYGIYVWHSVLAKLNQSLLSIPVGFLMLSFLLLSIPIALISFKFIESPLLRFKVYSGPSY